MNLMLFKILVVLYFPTFLSDPILPSYERDEGDWPVDGERNMNNVIDRWFIDIQDAKCKPLEYRGIKGNYNNFASKGLCEMHLGQLTTKEKLQGCKKPHHPGHCVKNTNTNPQFYFDQTKADCVPFQYNGCGGSFNRYNDLEECRFYCLNKRNGGLTNADDKIVTLQNRTHYEVPNILDCDLRPDVKDKDPSTAIIADKGKSKCAYAAVSLDSNTRGVFGSFAYPSTHTSDVPQHKKRVAACDIGPSQTAITKPDEPKDDVEFRYYYDKTKKVCKRMETGKHAGKADFDPEKNNFPTMEMCHSYCGAENYEKKIVIQETCVRKKKGVVVNNSGNDSNIFKVKRYYYKQSDHKCHAFYYKGYDGNSNNFETGEKCKAICSGHYDNGEDVGIEETIENDREEEDAEE